MPTSEKRIAANRANAAKSTGPKTRNGKRNSSLNSNRHESLADAVLIENECRKGFIELVNALVSDYHPKNRTQQILVEKMAVGHWRVLRHWTIEAAGITRETRSQAGLPVDGGPIARALLAIRALCGSDPTSDRIDQYEQR